MNAQQQSGIGADIVAFLTMLSAAPYELGPVAVLIPPAWKPHIFTVGVVATALLRLWQRFKDVKMGKAVIAAVPEVQAAIQDTSAFRKG